MPYVIAEPCTKDADCVEVCPVDCIHPRPDEPGFRLAAQLYINPEVCIECGSCYRVCMSRAVFSQEKLPPQWQGYEAKNARQFGGSAREAKDFVFEIAGANQPVNAEDCAPL